MRRKRLLRVATAVAALVLGLSAARPAAASTAADPVRIMPLGDSITGSPGCWRSLLWNQLQDSGHTAVDFVGTLGPQGCGLPYDGDNEGHGGALATVTADQGQLVGWLAATHPDIVVMHFGTNDVWSGIAPDRILAAFSTLVDRMRADNPAMKVLVAQILPMAPDNCAECGARVQALNALIPDWAAGVSTARSPVRVVDQWTGFDDATDTYDGVHPSATGDAKMAAAWFPALVSFLDEGAAVSGAPSDHSAAARTATVRGGAAHAVPPRAVCAPRAEGAATAQPAPSATPLPPAGTPARPGHAPLTTDPGRSPACA